MENEKRRARREATAVTMVCCPCPVIALIINVSVFERGQLFHRHDTVQWLHDHLTVFHSPGYLLASPSLSVALSLSVGLSCTRHSFWQCIYVHGYLDLFTCTSPLQLSIDSLCSRYTCHRDWRRERERHTHRQRERFRLNNDQQRRGRGESCRAIDRASTQI